MKPIMPLCIASNRVFPPEDSGAPWIYDDYAHCNRVKSVCRVNDNIALGTTAAQMFSILGG